jgi:hypothetical protein
MDNNIWKDGIKASHHEEEKVKEIDLDKSFRSFFRFLKKLSLITIIILILASLMYGGYLLKKCPSCEEQIICEECVSCPDLNCNDCPKQVEKITNIRYACSNGFIVDDMSECNPLNHVKITSPYKETSNGVILSIDDVEYESNGNYDKVISIDYTIINIGEHEIKPIVLVNLYSSGDSRLEQGLVHEVFDDGEYMGSNEWALKKQNTNIGFNGGNMTLRLILKDELLNKEMVRVIRPLEI